MKKLFIGMLLFIGIASVFILKVDFNRLGKTNVYIEVIEPTEVTEDVLSGGEVMKRYVYEQVAYDEKAEEVKIHFTAHKELRQGAYLRMYLNKKDEVTSYEEIQLQDVPQKVQEKI